MHLLTYSCKSKKQTSHTIAMEKLNVKPWNSFWMNVWLGLIYTMCESISNKQQNAKLMNFKKASTNLWLFLFDWFRGLLEHSCKYSSFLLKRNKQYVRKCMGNVWKIASLIYEPMLFYKIDKFKQRHRNMSQTICRNVSPLLSCC